MKSSIIKALLIACIVGSSAQTAFGDTILLIDFGSDSTEEGQPSPGPMQAGYVEWSGPYVGNPGLAYNETRSYEADFGIAGVVNVNVMSDGLFFRDYEPIVGGPFVDQSALLSDSILRNQPGSVFLSFSNLRNGVYSMTSFHHDTRHGSTFVPFDIILTDEFVSNMTVFSGLDTTGGTSPSTITTANYTFAVRGPSTVIVEFAGQAQIARHMSINGFQLERVGPAAVPETSSLLLLASGLAMVIAVGPMRRLRETFNARRVPGGPLSGYRRDS